MIIDIIFYTICFLGCQAVLGFGGQLFVDHVLPKGSVSDTTFLLVASALSSLIMLGIFIGFKFCPVSRNYVRTRPWSVLAWCVLLALGMILPLTYLEEFTPRAWAIDLMKDQLPDMLSTPHGYFIICMLAPLAEEVVFRGAMIRAISPNLKERTGIAIAVSAFLFALVHCNPAQIPHALIVGALLAWIYVRTGSIVPCFIIHWINNSSAYAVLKMFPTHPADAPLAEYFGGDETTVLKAVGFSLMIALPALYQLYILTRRKGAQDAVAKLK